MGVKMIHTTKGFHVKTNLNLKADIILRDWFNNEPVYTCYNDYLTQASEIGLQIGVNPFYLISVKEYMFNVVRNNGYHEFHLKYDEDAQNIVITRQDKLNKSFNSFEDLFERDEDALTPFVTLYNHYLSKCEGEPVSKVAFSRKLRTWCPLSVSKQKSVSGKPVRALSHIKPKQHHQIS